MKSGTYVYDKRINIDGRNGTHDNYITVMCPDGRAVLDFVPAVSRPLKQPVSGRAPDKLVLALLQD